MDLEEKIVIALKYWGYTEVYHYSFISEDLIKKTGLQASSHLKVANPLTSEIEFMRNSLFPSMLNTIVQNQDKKDNLKLFELAKVYLPRKSNLPKESSMVIIVNQTDFYDLKGLIESLLSELGLSTYQKVTNTLNLLHTNISLEYRAENSSFAWIGKLNPKLFSRFDIKGYVFVAYLDLEEVANRIKKSIKYRPVPLYPPVIEDMTFITPKEVIIGPIIEEVAKIPLVENVKLIDRFKNQITLKIIYQDRTKNLESSEVKTIREKIIDSVKIKFNAVLKR